MVLGTSVLLTGCKGSDDGSSKEIEKGEGYVHRYYEANKFEDTKFDGTFYDEEGNPYTFEEIKDPIYDFTRIVEYETFGRSPYTYHYYFTKDEDRKDIQEALTVNDYETDSELEYLGKTLGNPTTIYEKYIELDDIGKQGMIDLYYDCGDFIIIASLTDETEKIENPAPTITLSFINVITKEEFFDENGNRSFNKQGKEESKMYGKEITE